MRISYWSSDVCSSDLIAGLMRAADPTLDVFVSVSQQSVHYTGPTETWIDGGDLEPDDKNGYLDWVREMITVHEIDIFIPTRRRALIASASLPCRVHLPASIPTLEVLDDKYLFAAEFAGKEHHLPTHLAQGSEDLERLLAGWPASEGDPGPCVKPRHGVNGRSEEHTS